MKIVVMQLINKVTDKPVQVKNIEQMLICLTTYNKLPKTSLNPGTASTSKDAFINSSPNEKN